MTVGLPKWSNNGLSELASAMDSTQTTLTLLSGTGARFPSDNFPLRIWNDATFANPIDDPNNEIVLCTSRSGDVLTITRGQEGTIGVTHAVGNSVALVVTQKFRDQLETKIGLVFISSQVASASASIDFTTGIDGTFDEYVVTFTNVVPATDDAFMRVRVSQDAGSTFKATAGDYSFGSNRSSDAATNTANGSANAIAIDIATAGVSNTAGGGGINGELRFFGPSGTASNKHFTWDISTADANNFYGEKGAGRFDLNNAAIDALRFLMSAGNITSGIFTLYGVKK